VNGSPPSLAPSGRGAALLLALAAAWPSPARAAGDDSVAAANAKLQVIDDGLNETERSLTFVENEYVKKKDETDEQVRADRFAKGSAAFIDGDYAAASLLFYDLIGVPAFHSDPNYDEALFALAESLYQQTNYLGAHRYFRELLNLRKSHYKEGLSRYLDISGKLNDFSEIGQYVDAARGADGRLPPDVAYVYGKWLTRRTDLPLAERVKQATVPLTEVVSAAGVSRLQALYLLGVLQVQQGNLDEAAELFTRIVRDTPRDAREKSVQELSHLALGRIDYEQGKFSQAIDAYQEVDRDSDNFIPALYEIAWVFVKQGDYEKALKATDLLSEMAPDSVAAPEAKILEGHLFLKLARYQEASDTYKKVINEYRPVSDDLLYRLKLHDDPVKYFDDLLAQNDQDFDITKILPPAAAKWATTQQEVADAIRMTKDISNSRRGVDESNELAKSILKSIDEKGANAFPVLQEGFSRAEAVDTRLTQAEQELLTVQQQLLAGKLGELQKDLDAARKERQELEPQFRSLPKTQDEVARHRAHYREVLARIEKDVYSLQVQVDGFNAALNAIEKWVADTRSSRQGDPNDDRQFLAQVRGTRQDTADINDLIGTIRKSLKEEQLRSGNVSADEAVRARYQTALDKEHQILDKAQSQLGADGQAAAARVSTIEHRLEADKARVAEAKAALQASVALKAEAIRKEVEAERDKLRGYAGEVDTVSSDARNLVGRITYDSFKRVKKQFDDLVLKADVGLVDVAWTKKQDDTTKIQNLSKQKDRELKSLDDEFKEVLKDVD
jgi:tetratricopeptide (TPR) repeat protein